ncbi:MAG: hypothetical protein IKW81_07265 [Pseudobutyrivibrio sp.]|nr:hypothetical protein [Pseudobutyrivibrio sp.]
MSEKKITKAELKKMETARKKKFVLEAYNIFMDSYYKVLGDEACPSKLVITIKNNNHYIKFQAHCQGFAILVYRNGNIDFSIKEFCHGEHLEHLYEYTDDVDSQKKFLDKLRNELADKIMEVALEKYVGYHYFMDLIYGENHFFDAYDYFKAQAEEED